MKTYNNSFRSASLSRPPHKWVDKSHTYSYTDHLARIVPTLVDKFAPGEKFVLRETTNLWSSPFFAPIFSGLQNKSRVFAVPLRKIVPHFEQWITSQISDQMLSIYTTVRDIASSAFNEVVDNLFDKSLADFLGWPTIIRQWCIILHGVDYEDAVANWSLINDMQDTDYASPLAELRTWLSQDSPTSVSNVMFASDPFADLSLEKNWTKRSDNLDMRPFFDHRLSLIPFIAYQKVISDWLVDLRFQPDFFESWFKDAEEQYDDSNIHVTHTSSFDVILLDGSTVSYNTLRFLTTLRRIGYGKDYFTTASTEAQRGEPMVLGPERLDILFEANQVGAQGYWPLLGDNRPLLSDTDTGKVKLVGKELDYPGQQPLLGEVWAQVNESDQITPIKLRWQMALQRLLERENIGGYTRYTDFILGQYGIRVPDPYLLRSVYLGGYGTSINANPVVAQSDGSDGDENSSILGEVGATGRGFNQGATLRGRFAHDHCVLLCLSWNVAETYYYQGFRTIFTDLKKIDMPLWEMAGVGEQPLFERELFFDQDPDRIFGYQRRFSNHKIYHNEIHGEFRGNLQYFHTGRKFLARPDLGGDLIYQKGSDGHDRVFSVDPKVADPFRITKSYYYRHYMCV